MNTLEKTIQTDIMSAMKEKNEVRLSAVRSIKTAIMQAKTAPGAKKELEDDDILKIIQKLAKQRKESADLYTGAGRPELAEKELAEMAELKTYLPKELSEDEVRAEVARIIAEVGATSMKEMGKVMGAARKIPAEGSLISRIVKELLS